MNEAFPGKPAARCFSILDPCRAAMPLHELRRARAMTQKALAETLKVKQPAIAQAAKMERRADMYVSNLRGLIEAMGGRLKIIAEFPEGEVAITNFSDVGKRF